ncbi:MAG: anaerobic sulfatase-maturation protein [Bacteroidaceae bacterium]|nr:anaerobic sulfatase-maturation protein [Bacteroidaceae bacterium]
MANSSDSTCFPFSRPLYVMAKPAGARCNLACRYCYYLEKGDYYASSSEGPFMTDATLERYIQEYIQTQTSREINFTWHGGEPLMRPLDFYRKAVALQARYGSGRQIANCLQTNGLLLNDDWCRFLHDEGWLVGLSIDGTQAMHDAYRQGRNGAPSWERVMRAVELLERHHVEWNAMATVHQANVEQPLEFYSFFRNTLGCRYLQFTPIVERLLQEGEKTWLAQVGDEDCRLAPYSVLPHQWGNFLCAIFDEWVRHDVGYTFVQLFDATLAGWMGVAPGVCVYAEECGHAAVMEHNGDVYSCDHFVFPRHRLGNIHTHTLPQMLYGPQQTAFSRLKRDALPRQCRLCPWLKACHGECPRLRFARAADGEPGLNFLCAGYQRYFSHVAPYMDFMAQALRNGQPPALIMQALRRGEF